MYEAILWVEPIPAYVIAPTRRQCCDKNDVQLTQLIPGLLTNLHAFCDPTNNTLSKSDKCCNLLVSTTQIFEIIVQDNDTLITVDVLIVFVL